MCCETVPDPIRPDIGAAGAEGGIHDHIRPRAAEAYAR